MTRAIVPMRDVSRRLPEAGRIRFGVKTGRAMKAIDHFRFTGQDAEPLEQVAAMYGGTVKPWKDAPTPGQHEVITEASEVRIVLPPDPLGGTPIYEQWSGGGCQRRCDGETCETIVQGPDGGEIGEVPCMCQREGVLRCSPKLRLSVVLPDVKFSGVWRLDTGSWNAVHEIPGMVDMIQSLQARGLTRALLALEHRKTVSAGQTKRYIVPVLRLSDSMDALAAGQSQVGALAPPESARLALAAAPVDDDVIEAEVVEDPEPPVEVEAGPACTQKQTRLIHMLLTKWPEGDDFVEAQPDDQVADPEYRVILGAKFGVDSSKALTKKQAGELIDILSDSSRRAVAITWARQQLAEEATEAEQETHAGRPVEDVPLPEGAS